MNKFYIYKLVSSDEVVCVGKTSNLKSRYISHKKGIGKDFEKDFDKMLICECQSNVDSVIMEIILINYHKPSLNSSYKFDGSIGSQMARIVESVKWEEFNPLSLSAMDYLRYSRKGNKYRTKKAKNNRFFIDKIMLKDILKSEGVKTKDFSNKVGVGQNTFSKYLRIGFTEKVYKNMEEVLGERINEITIKKLEK